MSDLQNEMDDEKQLRLQLEGEELAKCGSEQLADGLESKDYEWDETLKGWFPKVDTDFLAAYQLSYGNTTEDVGTEKDVKETSTKAGDVVKYVDPQTKKSYLWDSERYLWINQEDPLDTMAPQTSESYNGCKYTDPSSGTVYVWSISNNQWVAENFVDPQTKSTYTWNEKEGKYLPPGGLDEDDEDIQENACTSEKNVEKPPPPKKVKKEASWFDMDESNNSNVYVYGLPLNIKFEEFEDMMKKYGIIMVDPDTGKPKLKLYTNPDGTFKGDGRCCYLKTESVNLALELLDGLTYRDGHKIGVKKAQFKLKGAFDPTLKKKRNKKKKNANKQGKLLDWRPEANRMTVTKKRHEKTVVLKNVFDARLAMGNLKKVPEIETSVKEVCSRFGEIKKVIVFDLHDEGVVSVVFRDWDAADLCVAQLNQRQVLGRTVSAEIWDGVTNYKIVETEEMRQQRIERWEQELAEAGDKKTTEPNKHEDDASNKSLIEDTVLDAVGEDEKEDSLEDEEERMKELLADLAQGGETFGGNKTRLKPSQD